MKFLAWTLLSGVLLFAAGCKPDAAVKRGQVVDQPTPKGSIQPSDKPTSDQQPSPTKVQ